MATAHLNVWVTAIGDPCHIDVEHQWFVHVLDCDGNILRWCGPEGRTVDFTNITTRCGQAEIEVPPGCYVVCATWSPGTSSEHLGNHLTHLAVVRVNCGDHACVTLFAPTLNHCRTWFEKALTVHAEAEALDRDLVARAIAAIGEALVNVPADPFNEAMQKINTE
jgi:hypothetical protein